ncbi:alpha-ketoglutarate dependent xanthine dioxygenase [Phakopsora pachyrhizi]|nr:alpha-ketoglutarate dependent xanthine dioxygenase [Phakopsora pachyrhizi]
MNKNSRISSKSILHPNLKRPYRINHRLFHKEVVSQEEDEKGVTRFYCWHIDAALYDLNPPKVTTLQALRVPQGPRQICRYNKGTGDQLDVLLGTTAFESRDQLPSFEESKIKTFPLLWKNPVMGNLHLQVCPCGAEKLIIEPLSKSLSISPDLVYCNDWKEKDLCLFHNRGVLHTVIGAFKEDQDRAFWQCNMASSDEPLGPEADDLQRFI